MTDPEHAFVGRGGLKLDHALRTFGIDVSGALAADLGCNVGGFTDCLLQHGACHVIAVDTGYGMLAWKLRNNPQRVTVAERTNALHADAASLLAMARQAPGMPSPPPPLSLVVADMGWTPQRHLLAAALRFLAADQTTLGMMPRAVIALVKPHYEADAGGASGRTLHRGVVAESDAETIARTAAEQAAATHGLTIGGFIRSPIRGGKGKGRAGNVEYLALYLAASIVLSPHKLNESTPLCRDKRHT